MILSESPELYLKRNILSYYVIQVFERKNLMLFSLNIAEFLNRLIFLQCSPHFIFLQWTPLASIRNNFQLYRLEAVQLGYPVVNTVHTGISRYFVKWQKSVIKLCIPVFWYYYR